MANEFDPLEDPARRALRLASMSPASILYQREAEKVLETQRALDKLRGQTLTASAISATQKLWDDFGRATGSRRNLETMQQRIDELARRGAFGKATDFIGTQAVELLRLHASLRGNSIGSYVEQLREQMRNADPYWVTLQQQTMASLGMAGVASVAERLRGSDLVSDFVGSSAAASYAEQAKSLLDSVSVQSAAYKHVLQDLLPPGSATRAYQERILEALRSPSEELKREVEEARKQVAGESMTEGTPEDAWQRFLAKIRGLDPAVAFLLMVVVGPLFAGLVMAVINPVADHHIKKWLSDSPQGQVKQASERVVQEMGGTSLLANYRMVRSKLLIVRASPKAAGKRFATLAFGTAVRVTRKEGASGGRRRCALGLGLEPAPQTVRVKLSLLRSNEHRFAQDRLKSRATGGLALSGAPLSSNGCLMANRSNPDGRARALRRARGQRVHPQQHLVRESLTSLNPRWWGKGGFLAGNAWPTLSTRRLPTSLASSCKRRGSDFLTSPPEPGNMMA
ncbi:hypothetical protein FN976_24390 [Caenimonas sedimenti]|uniref:Uncharacterized protein n=1 Tax=Caenimonas sedimenti TaxID=2596921 RepID=A0A562ZHK8_9BURK|nr:hypothetical protein [Caenimonas sedimenti]TWO68079.1 hypothetical protein FN976_24390 [Caenimonas sedimenti]